MTSIPENELAERNKNKSERMSENSNKNVSSLHSKNQSNSSTSKVNYQFGSYNKNDSRKNHFTEETEKNHLKIKKRNVPKINLTNYQSLSLEKLADVVVPLAKDQLGCRYLQKQIDDNPVFLNLILPNILSSAEELCNDPFGNYLIQKVITLTNLEQSESFINIIEPYIFEICVSAHGTRVIQTIVHKIKKNDVLLAKLTNLLYPIVIPLFKDLNANHIIQKFIKEITFPNNQFIYNILSKNLMELATDKHGCCVIQKCIEEGNKDQQDRLIAMLIEQGSTLVLDQYGNYVIQYIISLRDQKINTQIVSTLLPNIYNLSKEKFSSNVIEKVHI